MGKISVVINTYNAEQYLAQVLDSVKDFNEVLVCDMESTDNTVAIAKEYGCRIVTFPRAKHSIVEPARDFAIKQANNKWLLVVDADEIVTPELKQYLVQRIASGCCPEGLYIPRRNKFMGMYMRNFTCDYQLRFFIKDGTEWPAIIHCSPKIKGRTEYIPKNLQNVQLIHLDENTISQRIEKINRYSEYELRKRADRHYGIVALLYRPIWKFLRSYFIQGDFRCGVRGFVHAGINSIEQFILIAKIIEKRYKSQNHES